MADLPQEIAKLGLGGVEEILDAIHAATNALNNAIARMEAAVEGLEAKLK